MPENSPSARRTRRRRSLVIASAAAGAVLLSLASAGVVNAVSANTATRATSSLSGADGEVGDAVALALGAEEAEDVYSASIRVSYPTDILAIDPDEIGSEFEGMWSAVGTVGDGEGFIDFTVTRLGTSDGLAGDLDLGSLGFVAVGPGEATVTVESMQLVDSGLGVVEDAPERALTYTVATPPQPEPQPQPEPEPEPEVTQPPVTTTPVTPAPQTPPAATNGGGTFVLTGRSGSRSTGGTTSAAPQIDATTSPDRAPTVRLSSTSVEAGDTVTITVEGAAADTEHRFEFIADGTVLGTAISSAEGELEYDATIPATTAAGEYEIAVLADDSTVASAMLTVTETAAVATPAPSASATPATAADDDESELTDAEQASSASFPWPIVIIALVVLAAAGVVTALVIRARRPKAGEL